VPKVLLAQDIIQLEFAVVVALRFARGWAVVADADVSQNSGRAVGGLE
jgi:hypothetical protein